MSIIAVRRLEVVCAVTMISSWLIISTSALLANTDERNPLRPVPSNYVVDTKDLIADKTLLDIYVRIMRYQTAGQDMTSRLEEGESKPDDYLTIAVKNMNLGKKEDLAPYLQKINAQVSDTVLQISRNESCPDRESCRLSYDAMWAGRLATESSLPGADNCESYITYDLTVSYKGKSVTHGGVILYSRSEKGQESFLVYDGIIYQVNTLALDRMPLANATGIQFATTSSTEDAGMKLRASRKGMILESENTDNPIGYIPEGNRTSNHSLIHMAAAWVPCAAPQILSSTTLVAADNGDRKRTTIGLGESVALWIDPPAYATWSSTCGSLTSPGGGTTSFTAPKSPGTCTVFGTPYGSKTFTIIAPSGITITASSPMVLGSPGPPNSQIGAGTRFNFKVTPTTVSFANLTLQEHLPGENWTWPNGTAGSRQGGYSTWSVPANNTGQETAATNLYPSSVLFNGSAYVDKAVTIRVPEEYQNDSGQGVPFLQGETHVQDYRANLQTRVIMNATNTVYGTFQGPYR